MQAQGMLARAHAIADAGGVDAALAAGTLPASADVSLAEGLVIGLLRQGVRKFLGVLGHGNTAIGEVLRLYVEAGAARFYACRNEVAMAHAATALAWIYGETPAVLTSIGPGALQAFAGSLAAASNGVGVYHLYGDETTHGEGYNMQQVPDHRQGQFGRLVETMGGSYVLHTPQALREALRHGANTVHRRWGAGPFYLCLPINVQPQIIHRLRFDSLPQRPVVPSMAPADDSAFDRAAELISAHGRIVIKAGGGARGAATGIRALAEAIDAAVVLSPGSTGILPDAHPLNMHVGGSKGSISGNFAMENAELLIVIGSRAVCQSDCSGTGYPKAQAVININGNVEDAGHYNRTLALIGDIDAVVERLRAAIPRHPRRAAAASAGAAWREGCAKAKQDWSAFKAERLAVPPLFDAAWGREVLTQPVAIDTVARFATRHGAIRLFDAGDVQANGFQIVEDDAPGESVTESGASYMGFAASALLAGALADTGRYMIAFSGDGSFMMNPQILIDAVAHGARGMVVVFDNRRMGAISSLQADQYGPDFGTNDDVAVDYVAMANAVTGVKGVFGGFDRASLAAALREAGAHDGLSLVHVPVYWGRDPRGGMGAYGRWNVGPWCERVEALYAEQAI